jgi:hypothetical protein
MFKMVATAGLLLLPALAYAQTQPGAQPPTQQGQASVRKIVGSNQAVGHQRSIWPGLFVQGQVAPFVGRHLPALAFGLPQCGRSYPPGS